MNQPSPTFGLPVPKPFTPTRKFFPAATEEIAAEVDERESVEAAFAGMMRARQAFAAERVEFERQLARKDKVHASVLAEVFEIVERRLTGSGIGATEVAAIMSHVVADLAEAERMAEIDAVLDEPDVDASEEISP